MAKFIKSYSNYVKQTTHQTVNDGKIIQRDWTTIGGIDNFSSNENVLYRNNNFIISVNNSNSTTYDNNQSDWIKNDNGEDSWNLSDIETITPILSNDSKIVLKNNIYDLRDYAYFGSCKELFRSSISDILNKFPGELYVTDDGVKYFDNNISGYTYVGGLDNNNMSKYVYISNPFNINIHDTDINVSKVSDNLRYFANKGYKEYEVIKDGDTNGISISCVKTKDIGMLRLTHNSTNFYYDYYNAKGDGHNYYDEFREKIDDTEYTNTEKTYSDAINNYISGDVTNYIDTTNMGQYEMIAKITICLGEGNECIFDDVTETVSCKNSADTFNVYLCTGENCASYYYITDRKFSGYHIRPKNVYEKDEELNAYVDRRYLTNFFNNLDSFEKVLLNPNTSPIYTAKFNILSEDDFGFETQLKSFTFPINEGGYNIGNSTTFYDYINNFEEIGDLYDEYFSDNIYRMLTHESIKNFDWAYSNSQANDSDDYTIGNTKISNILRIYGREFDEIKQYIKGLKIGNNITYDGINNAPDYLLTDIINIDGWDLKNIYPYGIKNKNYYQIEDNTIIYYPYSKNKIKDNENVVKITHNEPFKESKPYFTDKKYNLSEINTVFYRMLKLNSRRILQSKGTINGIETLLSLFGLKSKRWVDNYNSSHSQKDIYSGFTNEVYDYDIKEYSTFMYPIKDTFNDNVKMNIFNYYNKAKQITYDNDNFYNGIYEDYQGLPVTYISGDTENIIYPYFNKNLIYDDNLYFQMKGGWMKIYPFDFDSNNNIVTSDNLFTETKREIKSVDNISDLLSMSNNDIIEGEIAFVINLSNKYVIIDSKVYEIKYEINPDGNESRYISVNYENNSVIVGDEIFTDAINISSYNTKNTDSGITNINVISLDTLSENSEIKIYIYDNNGSDNLFIYSDNNSVSSVKFYKDYISTTHYYKLNTIDGSHEISDFGWTPLTENDEEYKNINRYINYYKGNNPHVGHKVYDNGYDYLDHFYTLFKYPLQENLFDDSVFDKDYYIMQSTLSNFGFINLSGNVSTYCNNLYPEIEDDKIHIFSNILKPSSCKDNMYTIKCNNNSIIEKAEWLSGDTVYSSFTLSDNISKLINNTNDNNYLDDIEWIKKAVLSTNFNNTTYSVLNTKRIDINFRKDLFNNKDFTENTKYLLGIINNYLKQMMPSNAICKLNFNS